jgi:dihydroxyacetone kinase-like predicted kinase
MKDAVRNVKSGQVTYSVRDTSIDGIAIKEGDIMGIGDKGLVAAGSDIEQVAYELVSKYTDEDSEIISIYRGDDVSEEDGEKLRKRLEDTFPDVDVQCYYGGQPIYYYILSVE